MVIFNLKAHINYQLINFIIIGILFLNKVNFIYPNEVFYREYIKLF